MSGVFSLDIGTSHPTRCSNLQTKDVTHPWIPAYAGKTVGGKQKQQRQTQTPEPTETPSPSRTRGSTHPTRPKFRYESIASDPLFQSPD